MATTTIDKTPTPIWLRAGELVLAALVYFALARASLYFASLNASVTPIWLATGLAIAFLLLRGNALLPAVVAGAFAANYAVTPSLATAATIALGNGAEAFVATLLLQHWARGEQVFQSPTGIGKFAVIVTGVAAPISATIGVIALAVTGFAEWPDAVPIWITWWLGNLAGAILTTPALVLWARTIRGLEPAPRATNAFLSFAAALLISTIAFSPISPVPVSSRSALAFLVIMPLLWSALRLGLRETATMALLILSFAVWGVIAGSGPFIQDTLNGSLLLLVTFIVSATLPSLALAAERRQSQTLLDETRHELVQAQKLEALGTLTSGVAHDFNNLLAAFTGGMRMLERQNEERARTMDAMSQALERGSGLTRQLLAFARREPLKLERIDTAAALESARGLIRSSIKDHIRFEMLVTPGLWPVKADRS